MSEQTADTVPATSPSRAAAAVARAEAATRRAHALAQEGRSVPILDGSPRLAAQMRIVRAELPVEVGAARLHAFDSKLTRAGTVKRNGKEMHHLSGYATVFEVKYDMWDMWGEYEEFVAAGAADATLAADPDVVFLMNHRGVTMARTINNTLELSADDTGLADDAYLNPDRSDVQLLMSAVDDGLVTEQSFAFMIAEGWWSDDFMTYQIAQVDINRGDVSAVNYGANPHTSIAARAQELIAMVDSLPAGIARAAFDRLARRTDVLDLRTATRGGDPAPTPTSRPEKTRDAQQPTTTAGRSINHIEALLGSGD